jgi:hypothetical protein
MGPAIAMSFGALLCLGGYIRWNSIESTLIRNVGSGGDSIGIMLFVAGGVLLISGLMYWLFSTPSAAASSAALKCEKCGGSNAVGDETCRYCRSPLPRQYQAAESVAVESVASRRLSDLKRASLCD